PEPIIPSNLIVSPIIWELDWEIQQATLQEPALPECPEGKTYVPLSQRQTLLGTAHAPRALDTQAAVGPSCFYNLVTGGPVCTVIPSGTSKAAQSVPSLTLPVNFLQESWFHYPSHRGPGPISEENVSDRGPQFTSHVWKAFFKLHGVSVKISSGYHPQTNGQTGGRSRSWDVNSGLTARMTNTAGA
ncbi:hypothetical protein M9458_003296, partial [Cirrhinus mrigala]